MSCRIKQLHAILKLVNIDNFYFGVSYPFNRDVIQRIFLTEGLIDYHFYPRTRIFCFKTAKSYCVFHKISLAGRSDCNNGNIQYSSAGGWSASQRGRRDAY